MVAYGHKISGAASSESDTPFYFIFYIIFIPVQQDPGVGISHNDVCISVFFADIRHICTWLHNKTIDTAGCDIIHKLCKITVRCKYYLFAFFLQGRQKLF